jgi:four helix bundle protein
MDLVVNVYKTTKDFPIQELYGLTSQMRRAAVSVPSNIAEGLTRRTRTDKLHFLNISQSSLSELDTQLEISQRLGFLSESRYELCVNRLIEVQELLGGLIRSIR